MIDLNDVAKYMSSVKADDISSDSARADEIQSVVCELQDSIRNDAASAALLGAAAAPKGETSSSIRETAPTVADAVSSSLLSLMAVGAVVAVCWCRPSQLDPYRATAT